MKVPRSLKRLAEEVEGWIEFGCAAQALKRMGPLLEKPGARPVALGLRARALIALQQDREALTALTELRRFDHDPEWLALAEAHCRKRLDDVAGAVRCLQQFVSDRPRSAIGHFELGCSLALLGDEDRAIDELAIACGMDPDLRARAVEEEDLVSLRDNPDFRELLPPPH